MRMLCLTEGRVRVGYIWGLLAVSAAVASALVVITLPHLGGPGRTELFARFGIAAGIAAVGSTLLYAFFESGGGILALVLGDVFMVLGPGSMLLAISALAGRGARLRLSVIALSAVVLAVAVTTATVDKPASLVVKAAALSVLCLWVAWQTRRDGLAGQPGMMTLFVVNVGYGLFSAGRIVAGASLGWDSAVYQAAFSIYPTTAVGALAVAFTGAAVFRVLRFRGFGTREVEPTAAVHEIQGVVVALDEVPAVRSAFGTATVVDLLSGLEEACAVVATALEGSERSEAVTTETVTALVRAELERRGWSASEIGLVTVAPDPAAGHAEL